MSSIFLYIFNRRVLEYILEIGKGINLKFLDDPFSPDTINNIVNSNKARLICYINHPNNPLDFSPTNDILNLYFKLTQRKFYQFELILIGYLNPWLFKILYENSSILNLPNIHYYELKKDELKSLLFADIPQYIIHQDLFKQLLMSIPIKPKRTYDDSHFTSNKWTYTKWLNILLPGSGSIIEDENDNLYFNYLLTIQSNSLQEEFENLYTHKDLPTSLTNIFIIDDDIDQRAKKLWRAYFSKCFNINNIQYKILDPKSISQKNIDTIFEEIIDFKPHIVILDLLLRKEEIIGNYSIDKLVSFTVLKKLKQFNPGIQVLIFSANNNILKYQELTPIGIDGYIIKESPNESNPSFLYINYLTSNIKHAFRRSPLIDVYCKVSELKILLNEKCYFNLEQRNEIGKQLDSFYRQITKAQDHLDFSYSYINLHIILEKINKVLLIEENENWYYRDRAKIEYVIKYNSKLKKYHVSEYSMLSEREKNQGIRFLMIYLYYVKKNYINRWYSLSDEIQNELTEIYNFFYTRNQIVHTPERIETITKAMSDYTYFIKLLDLLILLLKNVD
ncbi:MAG: hypothetical protein N2490_06070 [Ignavibacteria bacterium]|nr:hypothetical protein [Ignavibacteria bacterium]